MAVRRSGKIQSGGQLLVAVVKYLWERAVGLLINYRPVTASSGPKESHGIGAPTTTDFCMVLYEWPRKVAV